MSKEISPSLEKMNITETTIREWRVRIGGRLVASVFIFIGISKSKNCLYK
jgi:hypothetical protein